jgi:hypothetical protein
MKTRAQKRPPARLTKAAMARLGKSDTLFRSVTIDRDGNRHEGDVCRALEAVARLLECRRMSDVTGMRVELEPVIAVAAPPAKRKAALAEIAAFV